jgi:hypothetical protein
LVTQPGDDQSKLSSAQNFEKLLISKLLEGKRSFPSLGDWALGAMGFYEILQLSKYCGWSLIRSCLLPGLIPSRLACLDFGLVKSRLVGDLDGFRVDAPCLQAAIQASVRHPAFSLAVRPANPPSNFLRLGGYHRRSFVISRLHRGTLQKPGQVSVNRVEDLVIAQFWLWIHSP